MQLHYNIIWFDDKINKFEDVGDIDRIREYLSELGFNPYILLFRDGKNIEQHFSSTKFDLIISDLSIEEGHHGDDIIREIRRKNIFTEVLFYSSQNNLKTIAEKLLTVDRVSFHSGRRGLIEKIEGLISLSVSKLLELNATRGLITAETSELDVDMEVIAHRMIENINPEDAPKIFNEIHKEIVKKQTKDIQNLQKMLENKDYRNYFSKSDAFRKWNLLKRFLELNCPKDFDCTLFKEYYKDVISIRNKFAHARALSKEGKMYLAGFGPEGDAFEFDEAQCISIRKKLINHRNNFNKLLGHLNIKIDK